MNLTDSKFCKRCGQNKPLNAFNRSKNRPDGLDFYCRECSNRKGRDFYHNKGGKKRQRRYYLNHKKDKLAYEKARRKLPDVRLKHSLARTHIETGVSYEKLVKYYNKQFKKQKGCCAVCGKHQTEFKNRLCIDHNHGTNKLRGLLCHNCNLAIGNLKDDAEICLKAYEYLRKN